MIDPQKPDFDNTPASPNRADFFYHPVDDHARPALSIITPFFNTGGIFHETAKSVLDQSLQQWEWLIINDGSTEPHALELLDCYRKKDPRIRVIDHPANLGLSSARNTGFHQAQTAYCLLLDSDDLLEPTAAEKWFWFLETHPEYAYAHSYSVCFGANQYLWQSGFVDEEANLERNRISLIVLARKAVHQKIGGFDENMRAGLEDWEFWVRSAAQGFWGATIPEYLVWVRTRSSHTDRWDNLHEDRLRAFRQELHEKYPQLWAGRFPKIRPVIDLDLECLKEDLPVENQLEKKSPRLLIVAPWMVVGGAERFNLDLMGQLVQRGWEITLAVTARSEHPWQSRFEEITPDVFPMPRFLEWEDYPRFLRYLILSRQIDAVLIASSQEGYRLLPYLRFHFPSLPIIDYLHFVTPDWMDGGFPRLSIIFQAMLDFSIVASNSLRNWMVKEGIAENRLRVCTINIDTEYWRPDPETRQKLRAQFGIQEDQALILYIARLEPQKRPDILAETVFRLSQQSLPFRALIIGGGALAPWLEEFIQTHDLQNQVHCLGILSSSEVRDWMAAGDIVFLPSENEGISATLYEAMACGLALVGSDVGGQSELVTPECGVLVPSAEESQVVEAYARSLTDLIRNPELRKKMGQAGRKRVVENFQLDKLGDSLAVILDEARSTSKYRSADLAVSDLVFLLTQQATQSMRARDEVRKAQIRIDQLHEEYIDLELTNKLKYNPPMPAAPARTYFYFTLRQLFYPLYAFLTRISKRSGWLNKLKNWFKRLFV